MGLLLLGIVPTDAIPPQGTPEHIRLGIDGWTAIAIEIAVLDEAYEDTIVSWAVSQNDILSRYALSCDVVPVALGSVFSDIAALRSDAFQYRSELEQAAERVRGCAEYAIRVDIRAESSQLDAACETGRGYLKVRKNRRDRRNRISVDRQCFIEGISDLVVQSAHESVHLKRKASGRVLDMAALVQRDHAPAFLQAIADHAVRATDLALACRVVGPGPAFSFVANRIRCDELA